MHKPLVVEKLNNIIVRPLTRCLIKLPSRQFHSREDETPDHRASGHAPETDEYKSMVANGFDDDFYLEIGGLVENPMRLTTAQLKEIAEGYDQTTMHHCV